MLLNQTCDICDETVDMKALHDVPEVAAFLAAVDEGKYDDVKLTEDQESIYRYYCCARCAKKILTS